MDNKFPAYKTTKVEDLIPYARNSRTHSDTQVDKIAASMREFGFLNPVIVDGGNGIIAGHGRIMAAKKLGMNEVPVVEVNHLTEAQKRAYVIADNRLASEAGWDDDVLKVEFSELAEMGFDIALTGFETEELSRLFDETGGITLDSDDDEKPRDEFIVRFPPEKRTDVMNAVNRAIEDIVDAVIWCDDE